MLNISALKKQRQEGKETFGGICRNAMVSARKTMGKRYTFSPKNYFFATG